MVVVLFMVVFIKTLQVWKVQVSEIIDSSSGLIIQLPLLEDGVLDI